MSHFGEIEFLASDNSGYFTSAAARRAGVESCELDRWVKSGRLERPVRGVYRLAAYPPTECEPYVVASLALGEDAYIWGESVLGLLNLAPTDPTRMFVAVGRRVRRKLPCGVVVCRAREGEPVCAYRGVRAQNLADAIRASRGYVRHDRRMRAVFAGADSGFLTLEERKLLEEELRDETTAQCDIS